jgi:DNA-binding MarR family transcriptional regulator
MEPSGSIGPMLGRCAHLTRERMDARLADCGITPSQTHVLLYLHKSGGTAPQSEVTQFLRVKPSTANGILDRMVERDLVTRSVSGTDARQRLITLTDRGREQKEWFLQIHTEIEQIIVRGFSPEESQQLQSLLERAVTNLEEDRNT